MGYKIINKQILAQKVKRLDVEAPDLIARASPGQFVMVMAKEGLQKIPLPIADLDSVKGTLALIFKEDNLAKKTLGDIPIGEEIFSLLGPLGKPAHIHSKGVVVCIATGIGTAQILPLCRALKQGGNKVVGIVGAKTKRSLMLEAQMQLTCDQLHIATNDGSYHRRGTAADILKEFLEQEKVNMVYTAGSVEMMQEVCQITKEKKISVWVQLNPVMIDGTGICGSCRVKVGGQEVLACLEGPGFDGRKIDFEDLIIRTKGIEESEECSQFQSNQKRSGSTTLTKFLSGILKK